MHIIAALVHTVPLLCMRWGFGALGEFVPDAWINQQRGGHFQFLTIQGLFLAKATLVLCIMSDFLPQNLALMRTRRAALMIALPLSIVVSAIYWSLITLAPGLIAMTPVNDTSTGEPTSQSPIFFLPLPVDVALHLSPVLSLALHFLLVEKAYNKRWQKLWAPLAAVSYAAFYASFQEWCASANGTFSYPFLNVPIQGRLGIYTAATLLAIGSFRVMNKVHRGYPLLTDLYHQSTQHSKLQ